MRGRQHADIHGNRVPPAQPLQAFFLQHPQQFHLCARREVANFIQKNRPLMRLLKPADPLRGGSRKRPALMAEQFALQQILGNRRAIDGDERFLRPVAMLVNRPRNQFLARPGFAANQHVHRLRRHSSDFLVNFLHRRAPANDRIARRTGLAQRHRLGHQPVAVHRPADQFQQLADIKRF